MTAAVRMTALVVEDDAVLLPVYADFLERIGYAATGVTNGAEVLTEMEHHAYDLVPLDLRLSAKTGFEVLRDLRPDHPNACIIMVSGCVSDEFAATALRLGADSYVTKPCSLGYLAERIQDAEELRATTRQGEGRREVTGFAA